MAAAALIASGVTAPLTTSESAGSASPLPLVSTRHDAPRSLLYVWAGDKGPALLTDTAAENEYDAPDDQDFLAVVDADPVSPTYGKILRTVSVFTPPTGTEPHHVAAHVPRSCNRLVANGLFSDTWFTFDLTNPLEPSLTGTIGPHQTLGTVPQFPAMLPNCEVLGTQQGGPAFDSRGTVVRFDRDGRQVVEERPAARVPTDLTCTSQWELDATEDGPGGPYVRKTSSDDCLPPAPLGIAVRADLGTVVTSDFAAPLPSILPISTTEDVTATALTVRHYALDPTCTGASPPPLAARCIGDPAVALLPDGPRVERDPRREENVVVEGLAATYGEGTFNPTGATPPDHLPGRGAFAATTCGGALFYTSDVTVRPPAWREVFDFSAAGERVNPGSHESVGCVGGGGLLVTPDNRFVVASVIGREHGQHATIVGPTEEANAFPGMIVLLDVQRLIRAGLTPSCSIDDAVEVWSGGAEADCPAIADVHVVEDTTSGGPHDLALDHQSGGHRLAFFDYFVSETGVTGDLRACILRIEGARLSPDRRFPAAVDSQAPGTGCINFDRPDWPPDRGARAGPAKPHHGMFWSN